MYVQLVRTRGGMMSYSGSLCLVKQTTGLYSDRENKLPADKYLYKNPFSMGS